MIGPEDAFRGSLCLAGTIDTFSAGKTVSNGPGEKAAMVEDEPFRTPWQMMDKSSDSRIARSFAGALAGRKANSCNP